jgi:hypothetical protein
MAISFLGFQKSQNFANKTHNYEQLVLVELSTCDVDVESKLKAEEQNSTPSGAFMISPSRSMILSHE